MFPLVLSLITLFFYFLSKTNLFSVISQPLLSLSQITSLVGVTLLAYTFILSSRLSFLEKYFGSLDKIYKKHHLYGASTFLLLISHPLLLAIQAFLSSSPTRLYLLPSSDFIYSAGVMALYSLILFLTFTLLIKLPYHLWYFTHQLMGIVLFFTLIHVNFIISDVSRSPILKLWIIAWLLLALISYLYKRFFYTRFGPKFNYQVDQVKNINGLLDIYLKPTSSALNHHPGQFVFISFHQNDINPEFHPFSLASSPASTKIHLCLKVLGDFTGSLLSLQENTSATIVGPYGQLYLPFETPNNIILIAGGIGITPFIGMIETEILRPQNRQINLFYSNRNIEAAFYHQNFLKITAKNLNIKYHPVFTDSQPRLNAQTIQNQVSDFQSSLFILCGPQNFMTDLKNQLLSLKINSKNIYYEDFSLT